ncbi:hypothetical protein C488_03340 [Natrinema pellirubrum DSM 15624]|uniref:Uncharacterized protein n=1 Tax=Natrinema pellirubrum (strain DSM 15624 / CIP 106293 / JCM 10476 / NCIMB 786 / 157) TaxID=797303 RepID=L9Z2P3_NATP1|nr:hypothetical protein C488_03340 [Natrinema pellirubrum DSM 15624]
MVASAGAWALFGVDSTVVRDVYIPVECSRTWLSKANRLGSRVSGVCSTRGISMRAPIAFSVGDWLPFELSIRPNLYLLQTHRNFTLERKNMLLEDHHRLVGIVYDFRLQLSAENVSRVLRFALIARRHGFKPVL